MEGRAVGLITQLSLAKFRESSKGLEIRLPNIDCVLVLMNMLGIQRRRALFLLNELLKLGVVPSRFRVREIQRRGILSFYPIAFRVGRRMEIFGLELQHAPHKLIQFSLRN